MSPVSGKTCAKYGKLYFLMKAESIEYALTYKLVFTYKASIPPSDLNMFLTTEHLDF